MVLTLRSYHHEFRFQETEPQYHLIIVDTSVNFLEGFNDIPEEFAATRLLRFAFVPSPTRRERNIGSQLEFTDQLKKEFDGDDRIRILEFFLKCMKKNVSR